LKYIRVTRDAQRVPLSLDTAIIRFKSAEAATGEVVEVDLIGAVHVGDADYYRQLNDRFRQYDAVLYELIAPEGMRVPRGGGQSHHPVGRMQQAIKSMLDLTFQLEQIDYTVDNLVHADMSPKEFAASMRDRGESFIQILFRMMGQAAAQASREDAPSDLDLLKALFATDRARQLKRVMAVQFEDLEGQISVFEGPQGSTVISERNKRAMAVLRDQLKPGKRKVAIFYGAGHMPDLAKRVQQELSLRHQETLWLTAWNLQLDKKP
jgi:hypothetical protein